MLDIIKFRKKLLLIVLIISIFFSIIIAYKGIEYEFGEKDFLPKNEIVEANEKIIEEYTNEYFVPILVKSKNGNILEKENLIEILLIEKRLNENLGIEPLSIADIISSSYLSINNISNFSYENKIEAIEKANISQILNLPFIKPYLFVFLSKDFNGKKAEATIIKVALNGSLIKDDKKALENETRILETIRNNEHIEVSVLGARIISQEIMKANNKSISMLLPLSFFLVIIVLTYIYKDFFDLIMSLIAIGLAILWTIGFTIAVGYKFNPLITSIPVLLVGIGIDYAIHIRMRIREIKKIDILVALLLSAFTTSVAFLSNISSSIPTLKKFGIICSFGIFSCFFITLSLMSYKGKGKKEKEKFVKVAYLIKNRKKEVAFLTIFFTIISISYALKIEAEFDMMDFLPKEMKISQEIEYLFRNFEEAQREEAIIMIKGNITNPSMLKEIAEIEENIKNDKFVVKYGILSILSLMKDYAEENPFDLRYNKSFSIIYKKYFENNLPRENVSSEEIKEVFDFLFEIAPNDAKRVLHRNKEYDECIIRIATNTGKKEENITILYNELKEDLNNKEAIITGGIISGYVILKAFRNSQLKSLLLTILISFIVLEIVFLKKSKSFLIGFISLIPVILSAIWIIGTMSLLSIPLTITTITVASLAVGLGIDYSIHMTYRFLKERNIEKTISSTGYALLGSALTTIAAFALLAFAALPPLRLFGISIAIGISFSYIACVFILPVLLASLPSFK